ncbi:MAG: acyl-protein synthetase [Magnetospiraceae bacterium]
MTDTLFQAPLYRAPDGERDAALLAALRDLTNHHLTACPDYRRIVAVAHPGWEQATRLDQLPFLPVGLFKQDPLSSIDPATITGWVTSSGTTGNPARLPLDAAASRAQARALAAQLMEVFGPARLPMILLADRAAVSGATLSAGAAAVLGVMRSGFDHLFLLDADGQVDRPGLDAFLERHGDGPFALFGFTFQVWQALERLRGKDFTRGILLHGGGWKKLMEQAVSAEVFRQALQDATGLTRVVDYYGMAEQIGTLHLETAPGLFRPPAFARVIARDPVTLAPLPHGAAGVLQLFSLLPRSYPGHSLLTEDLGVTDPSGFRVLGRVPKSVARGCSDAA